MTSSPSGLTPRDIELLSFTFRCMKDKNFDVDLDQFVNLSGLKNANTARTVIGQLKRKITTINGNGDAPKPAAKCKPKGRPKRVAEEDAAQTEPVIKSEPEDGGNTFHKVKKPRFGRPSDELLAQVGALQGDKLMDGVQAAADAADEGNDSGIGE